MIEPKSLRQVRGAKSDLFIRLAKSMRPASFSVPEDFVTECFAAALREDAAFGTRFLRLLDESLPGPPERIWTQETHGDCRPDLFIGLADGRTAAVEIKLEAKEGPDQLRRYLKIAALDYVAYLAPASRPVDPDVYGHPKFLKAPAPAGHHLWSDVYTVLADVIEGRESPNTILNATLGVLDYLGFAPPSPVIGDLNSSDKVVRQRARANAGKLLVPSVEFIRSLGFTLSGNFQGQIVTLGRTDVVPQKVWVNAVDLPGMLSIKLYAATEDEQRGFVTKLESGDLPHSAFSTIVLGPAQHVDKSGWYVDVRVPLSLLIPSGGTVAEVQQRLFDIISSAVTAVSGSTEKRSSRTDDTSQIAQP